MVRNHFHLATNKGRLRSSPQSAEQRLTRRRWDRRKIYPADSKQRYTCQAWVQRRHGECEAVQSILDTKAVVVSLDPMYIIKIRDLDYLTNTEELDETI